MEVKPHKSYWDSNPAQPQIGTWTHCLYTEIIHLVSGLNEAGVLYDSLQKEFNESQSNGSEVDLYKDIHIP